MPTLNKTSLLYFKSRKLIGKGGRMLANPLQHAEEREMSSAVVLPWLDPQSHLRDRQSPSAQNARRGFMELDTSQNLVSHIMLLVLLPRADTRSLPKDLKHCRQRFVNSANPHLEKCIASGVLQLIMTSPRWEIPFRFSTVISLWTFEPTMDYKFDEMGKGQAGKWAGHQGKPFLL